MYPHFEEVMGSAEPWLMAKHRAKFGWPPVSNAAVTKARRETG